MNAHETGLRPPCQRRTHTGSLESGAEEASLDGSASEPSSMMTSALTVEPRRPSVGGSLGASSMFSKSTVPHLPVSTLIRKWKGKASLEMYDEESRLHTHYHAA